MFRNLFTSAFIAPLHDAVCVICPEGHLLYDVRNIDRVPSLNVVGVPQCTGGHSIIGAHPRISDSDPLFLEIQFHLSGCVNVRWE
jgi:hypothetical protein